MFLPEVLIIWRMFNIRGKGLTWRKCRLCRKNIFSGNQEKDILAEPFRCPKHTPPGTWTSDLQAWSPTLWPLCYKTLAFKVFCFLILSLCPGCKGLGFSLGCSCGKQFLGFKNIFFRHCSCETQASPDFKKKSGSKKLLFLRCSYETQTSPALQKKQFFRPFFLRMSLVKSANSTLLPRFSSLQIA